MKKQGIYKIRNIINNKIYIGSSKNIDRRFKRHKKDLNNNCHCNIILQRAWNKYGSCSFVFEIVEQFIKISPKELLIIEQLYLDKCPNKYNIAPASGGDMLTNHPNRKDIIQKISKSVKERYENMTEDEREILSNSRKGSGNSNWRGGVSKNFCKCGVEIKPINNSCNKCYDKSGKNNPFYGKTHSEKAKRKISKKRKGSYNGNQEKPIMIDGVEYKSLAEASRKLNIPTSTICYKLKSLIPKNKNYKYI